MKQYYFAFKVNPIDVMRFNFPRPQSQDYGMLCESLHDAQEWLSQAETPEHNQDWFYSHYGLPALDIIITGAPVTTRSVLPDVKPGEPVAIFAHRMREVDITNMYVSMGPDEVHGTHMIGSSQGKHFDTENLLLRSACNEMHTRMMQLEEYHRACEAHPEVPKEVMKTWATLMFAQDVTRHKDIEEYFRVFAEHYAVEYQTQDIVRELESQAQYDVAPGVILAIESAARYLYSEFDVEAFENILDGVRDDARPFLQARFMQALEPDNYKALMLEHVPAKEQDVFSKMWDSKLTDLRISNQVALRKGSVREQDLALQTAIHVCTEMEYTAFRAQSGTQNTYSLLRSAAVQDEVKLEAFDNPEMNELEEEIH